MFFIRNQNTATSGKVNQGTAVGSTSNAFKLIQAIVDSGNDGATFTSIVGDSGVPKSTAHRLLRELTEIGAIEHEEGSRTYAGGLLLARLGSAVMSKYDIRNKTYPHLVRLHEQTGHTVTLGVRDGGQGTYVDKIDNRDFGIRLHSEIGKSFPLHCTGIGKVMLAWSSAAERQLAMAGKLKAYTKSTITDKRELARSLKTIRRNGYGIDDEEITRGFICIAAPVFGPDGNIAGALSCTLPTYVRDERGIDNEIALVVQAAAGASR